ncbi:MAG: phage tail tube protein [Enterocloster sp.]
MEVNREDVQMGMNVDSKMTGLKGSGTLSIKKVYSRAKAVLEKLSAGQDVRCQIIAKLKDPDAVDGQIERWSTDNVWWEHHPGHQLGDRGTGTGGVGVRLYSK